MKRRHLFSTALLTGIMIPASATLASTTTWTGATDSNWNDNSNWTDSEPNQFPSGTGTQAIFDGTPGNQPTTAAAETQRAGGLYFKSGGWTIGGDGEIDILPGSDTYKSILADAGVGTNTISADIDDFGNPPSGGYGVIDIGANSTLVHTGNLELDDWWGKDGAGTLVLGGTSSGSRGVLANAGTLLVNGTTFIGFNRTDDVTGGTDGIYEVSGTYGGNGTVDTGGGFVEKVFQFQSGSTLSPGGDGTNGAEIGTLTINNTSFQGAVFEMQSGSTLEIDLGNAAGVNDLIDLVGGNDPGVAAFDLTANPDLALFGDLANPVAGSYTIATWDEGDAATGSFGSITYNGADISSLVTPQYNANDITLTIVPEPASLALMGLGGLCLLGRRRK